MSDALASSRAPFDAGHHHIAGYGLAAAFAGHIGLIGPYLVAVMAEDTNEVFG